MKALGLWILMILTSSLFMVACNTKNEGNKDAEIVQAKEAYSRCVSLRGQSYCNTAKAGALASVSEYYGQGYYSQYYGYNNYLMANPNTLIYSQDQINTYFDTYLKDASKSDILLLSNRFYQMTTEPTPLYYPNTLGRTCNAWGCY